MAREALWDCNYDERRYTSTSLDGHSISSPGTHTHTHTAKILSRNKLQKLFSRLSVFYTLTGVGKPSLDDHTCIHTPYVPSWCSERLGGEMRRKINRRAAHTLYSDAASGTVTTAVAGWDGPRIYGIPQITHRHTHTHTHSSASRWSGFTVCMDGLNAMWNGWRGIGAVLCL